MVSKRKKKTYKDKKISLDSRISIAIFSAMIYEARPIQVSRKETDKLYTQPNGCTNGKAQIVQNMKGIQED